MRQRLIQPKVNGHAPGSRVTQVLKEDLIARIARTEQQEVGPAVQNAPGDIPYQVDPFLVAQPGDNDNGRTVQLNRHAEARQQVGFAQAFSAKVFWCVVGSDVWVSSRIPFVIIHAIEDAHQIVPPQPEQTVHAEAVLWCLDFLGIPLADGRQGVRSQDGALEHASGATELQPVGPLAQIAGQAKVGQVVQIKKP